MENRDIIILSGGFDPIHPGHIAMIQEAAQNYNFVIVGVNSDEWLIRKKGFFFQTRDDRVKIVQALEFVDKVISDFNDDGGTACGLIQQVCDQYQGGNITFANGGDRTADNIPEMISYSRHVEFVFGMGGTKKYASSSEIVKRDIAAEKQMIKSKIDLLQQDYEKVRNEEMRRYFGQSS